MSHAVTSQVPRTDTPADDRTAHREAPLSRWKRVCRHPATWFWFAPLIMFVEALFLGPAGDAGRTTATVLTAASGVAAWLMYRFVMRRVAHRPVPELGRRGALGETVRGAGLGAAYVVVSVGVIAAFGGYHFHGGAPHLMPVLVSSVVAAAAGAVAEELAFRGIALQALERIRGSWFALVVTALLFGAAHAANPDAGLWSSVAIAVEAGGVLGAAFLWRRNLWFAIGLHTAWNAIEGLVGIPVSGHVDPGLTTVSVHGPTWLTGGSFGLEASLVPFVLGVALSAGMLVAAGRRRTLVRRGR